MGALIEIDRVSKVYGGGSEPAVDNATLHVPKGALIAIVGLSGSGKTTLMKIVNRLVEPDTGEVRIGNTPIAASEPSELRRRIGYVFQGAGLFPHFTIAENIAITPRLCGWPEPRILSRIRELLDLVELPQAFAARFPAQLSGGQQQRVAIARALAAEPPILLMDEPFGALDPVTRDNLGRAYRALHDKLGLTTVMVTHDMQEAILLADRIVVMKAGRILADVPAREILKPGADPEIAALVEVPLRQARRVNELHAEALAAERP